MLYGYLNSPFVSNPFSDAAIPPSSVASPVISGSGVIGQTLSTTNGTWSGTLPITYTYQWNRNGSVILGATFNTYTLVTADGSTSITCTVTATNAGGSLSKSSNAISVSAAGDADANAFISAAAITDATQKSAIDKLVVDLKSYGIWTKMNAIYPFVGGTSLAHKYNLKDARDLDIAYRLIFSGGWIHNSNGITGNKINTFANTFLNYTTLNSGHQSLYSRSNIIETIPTYDMGVYNGGNTWQFLSLYSNANLLIGGFNSDSQPRWTLPDSSGLFINNRTASNSANLWRNGSKLIQSAQVVGAIPNLNTFIGSLNQMGTAIFPGSKNYAFSSIGDGLTDIEAANYYTAVQTFQTTLGRQVGVPIVSDSDAQAFLNAAVIEDLTQANAVNTLVTDLKGYGIWTKMKAIYPFIGGSAFAHKFNLRSPIDTDAAFRLVFNGGWVHSSTGSTPNGTNAFANTFLIPNSAISQNSACLSIYSRTNNIALINRVEMGSSNGTSTFQQVIRFNNSLGNVSLLHSPYVSAGYIATKTSGFFLTSRTGSTTFKKFEDGVLRETLTAASVSPNSINVYLGARNDSTSILYYDSKQYAFAHIGDGLTDTEAANYYTAVQAFQTSLSRNV
jgi:hypothetical protein